MRNAKHFPPEDLVHDLTMSLWRERAALRDLARRKAWEPSIDDRRRLAERQVEQLKSHGVLEDGENGSIWQTPPAYSGDAWAHPGLPRLCAG
jgi:hypothetical protein